MPKEYKEFELAKAIRKPVSHLWSNPNWIAETKEDGHRYLLHFGGNCSRTYMTSRGGEEVGLATAQFAPRINTKSLGYTVLDGEIIPPAGSEFHRVASYTRVNPLNANSRRKDGEIIYKPFDILFINNTDVRGLSLEKRIPLLDVVLSQVYNNHELVQPVKRATNNTYKFLIDLLTSGAEGVILKNLKSTYGSGWIKAKRVSTIDVFITGFLPGYDAKYGSVVMSVSHNSKIREVGKCGIIDPVVRAAINKDPNSFIGRVIEIQALKLDTISGSLREPIFIKLRPDLKPIDASWEKLQRDIMKITFE